MQPGSVMRDPVAALVETRAAWAAFRLPAAFCGQRSGAAVEMVLRPERQGTSEERALKDAREAKKADAPRGRSARPRTPDVLLFTDGACQGNPGPGGWAYVLKHPGSGTVQHGYGSAPRTTNNQMELQAVIRGLEALRRPCRVHVVTDSEYVAKGCREWLPVWKQQGWRRRQGKSYRPVKNEELWRRLDELLQRHDVTFQVVRGHSGHPENELCDRLAVQAASEQLPPTVERFDQVRGRLSDSSAP